MSVYDSLIESVHANLDKMYRYVALRRRLLGADELHMYDVYTPIVPDVAEKIPFEQAKATVLDALAVLGEDYTAMLRGASTIAGSTCTPNVGKRGGAYSSGIARPHPYVLLNQTDDLDSQFTIAHEMGHAMHSYLSCKHQPVLHERLRHLRRRGRLDLQRGAAHAASAAQEHRQARAGLPHQSFP